MNYNIIHNDSDSKYMIVMPSLDKNYSIPDKELESFDIYQEYVGYNEVLLSVNYNKNILYGDSGNIRELIKIYIKVYVFYYYKLSKIKSNLLTLKELCNCLYDLSISRLMIMRYRSIISDSSVDFNKNDILNMKIKIVNNDTNYLQFKYNNIESIVNLILLDRMFLVINLFEIITPNNINGLIHDIHNTTGETLLKIKPKHVDELLDKIGLLNFANSLGLQLIIMPPNFTSYKIKLVSNSIIYPVCSMGYNRSVVTYMVIDTKIKKQKLKKYELRSPHGAIEAYDPYRRYEDINNDNFLEYVLGIETPITENIEIGFKKQFGIDRPFRFGYHDLHELKVNYNYFDPRLTLDRKIPENEERYQTYWQELSRERKKAKTYFDNNYFGKAIEDSEHTHIFIVFVENFLVVIDRLIENATRLSKRLDNIMVIAIPFGDPIDLSYNKIVKKKIKEYKETKEYKDFKKSVEYEEFINSNEYKQYQLYITSGGSEGFKYEEYRGINIKTELREEIKKIIEIDTYAQAYKELYDLLYNIFELED